MQKLNREILLHTKKLKSVFYGKNIIKWNKKAIEQFENAIAYIEEDSIANAHKFKVAILNKIVSLLTYPEKTLLTGIKLIMTEALDRSNCIVTGFCADIKGLKFVLSE